MNFYRYFAPRYDQTMGNKFFEEWSACFEVLCKEYPIKYKSILDVACGTGNTLLYFYKKGKQVLGVDRSVDMLKQAKRKIGNKNIEIKQMDMSSLNLEQCSDLITCNFNAINDVRTLSQLKKVFKSFYKHLNFTGWMVFDFISIMDGRGVKDEPQVILSKKDCSLTFLFEDWHEKTKEKDLNFFTFIRRKGNNYQLIKYTHKLKTFFVKDVRKLLKTVGLKKIFIHRWSEFGPPNMQYSRRYIVIAQK